MEKSGPDTWETASCKSNDCPKHPPYQWNPFEKSNNRGEKQVMPQKAHNPTANSNHGGRGRVLLLHLVKYLLRSSFSVKNFINYFLKNSLETLLDSPTRKTKSRAAWVVNGVLSLSFWVWGVILFEGLVALVINELLGENGGFGGVDRLPFGSDVSNLKFRFFVSWSIASGIHPLVHLEEFLIIIWL